MKVYYDSMTGNVKRFIQKLNLPCEQIQDGMLTSEDYILITYTTGFGNVPEKVENFLQQNHGHLQAVAASGNRNWGDMFGASGDKIANQYHVPLLHKFELAGTEKDVEIFKERIEECLSLKW